MPIAVQSVYMVVISLVIVDTEIKVTGSVVSVAAVLIIIQPCMAVQMLM